MTTGLRWTNPGSYNRMVGVKGAEEDVYYCRIGESRQKI